MRTLALILMFLVGYGLGWLTQITPDNCRPTRTISVGN